MTNDRNGFQASISLKKNERLYFFGPGSGVVMDNVTVKGFYVYGPESGTGTVNINYSNASFYKVRKDTFTGYRVWFNNLREYYYDKASY